MKIILLIFLIIFFKAEYLNVEFSNNFNCLKNMEIILNFDLLKFPNYRPFKIFKFYIDFFVSGNDFSLSNIYLFNTSKNFVVYKNLITKSNYIINILMREPKFKIILKNINPPFYFNKNDYFNIRIISFNDQFMLNKVKLFNQNLILDYRSKINDMERFFCFEFKFKNPCEYDLKDIKLKINYDIEKNSNFNIFNNFLQDICKIKLNNNVLNCNSMKDNNKSVIEINNEYSVEKNNYFIVNICKFNNPVNLDNFLIKLEWYKNEIKFSENEFENEKLDSKKFKDIYCIIKDKRIGMTTEYICKLIPEILIFNNYILEVIFPIELLEINNLNISNIEILINGKEYNNINRMINNKVLYISNLKLNQGDLIILNFKGIKNILIKKEINNINFILKDDKNWIILNDFSNKLNYKTNLINNINIRPINNQIGLTTDYEFNIDFPIIPDKLSILYINFPFSVTENFLNYQIKIIDGFNEPINIKRIKDNLISIMNLNKNYLKYEKNDIKFLIKNIYNKNNHLQTSNFDIYLKSIEKDFIYNKNVQIIFKKGEIFVDNQNYNYKNNELYLEIYFKGLILNNFSIHINLPNFFEIKNKNCIKSNFLNQKSLCYKNNNNLVIKNAFKYFNEENYFNLTIFNLNINSEKINTNWEFELNFKNVFNISFFEYKKFNLNINCSKNCSYCNIINNKCYICNKGYNWFKDKCLLFEDNLIKGTFLQKNTFKFIILFYLMFLILLLIFFKILNNRYGYNKLKIIYNSSYYFIIYVTYILIIILIIDNNKIFLFIMISYLLFKFILNLLVTILIKNTKFNIFEIIIWKEIIISEYLYCKNLAKLNINRSNLFLNKRKIINYFYYSNIFTEFIYFSFLLFFNIYFDYFYLTIFLYNVIIFINFALIILFLNENKLYKVYNKKIINEDQFNECSFQSSNISIKNFIKKMI